MRKQHLVLSLKNHSFKSYTTYYIFKSVGGFSKKIYYWQLTSFPWLDNSKFPDSRKKTAQASCPEPCRSCHLTSMGRSLFPQDQRFHNTPTITAPTATEAAGSKPLPSTLQRLVSQREKKGREASIDWRRCSICRNCFVRWRERGHIVTSQQ